MRRALNIDNSTLASLVFILGTASTFVTKKNRSTPKLIPSDVAMLADLIIKKDIEEDTMNKVIKIFGYTYDPEQDIFYTTMYPWQRGHGYNKLFDDAAAVFSMIIDCEPIYFEYDNKRWLIGLWKGQYGMTTGGEIGVYSTDKPDINIPGIFKGALYRSINDADRLRMSFSLKKNGKTLFTRKARHWWLAGFKLGEFSEPSQLTMDVKITLKDKAMRDAFIGGLKGAGYSDNEIIVNENTVKLKFDDPRSVQPVTRTPKTDWVIQRKNELLCNMYRDITTPYINSLDKIKEVQKQATEIYKIISVLAG